MSYITTTEFKTEYPQVDITSYSDATLQTILDKATRRVDNYIGYSLTATDVSNERAEGLVDEDYNFIIFPRIRPVNSVSALSIIKSTTEITIDLTDGNGDAIYDIPEPKNRIIIPYRYASLTYSGLTFFALVDIYSLRNRDFYTKLSYNGGYSTIPDDIKDATALFVLDNLSRRYNLSGASSVSQGGISISYGGHKRGKSDFVMDAENILDDYRKASDW